MAARKPTPAPALPDELVEEILLRMPPDEPAGLVRAAVACKGWCRLVSCSGFRRRFRERHRTSPMLGAICNLTGDDGARIVRFVSAASSLMRAERRGWRAVNSRHGRVLLQRWASSLASLAVWDPLADHLRELPPLPRLARSSFNWNATVVCAAVAGDCDHLDCPFLVVFLGSDYRDGKFIAYLYSSKADAWSTEPTTTYTPRYRSYLWAQSRVLHLSNALYFLATEPTVILRYDLVTRELTAIDPPPVPPSYISLSTMEGGVLGCAEISVFRLYLWSREGEMGWAQTRAIEIRALLPAYQSTVCLCLNLYNYGDISMKMDGRVFTIDIELGEVRLVHGDPAADRIVIPYKSFYTPVLEVDSARVDQGAGT